MYDLVLKGGTVIDPAQNIHDAMDVALADGRVAALEEDVSSSGAKQTVNVTGKLVVPGLIDLHAHVYPGATQLGLDPDPYFLAKGTTTLLDAGSAGALNLEGLRRFVVEPARTRILALLNISAIGMPSMGSDVIELGWLPLADANAALEAIEANRDWIWGLKARLSDYIVRENGIQPLRTALAVARQAQVPLMVHIGDTPVPLGQVLDMLRPGDIVTHIFTAFNGIGKPFQVRGSGTNLLDAQGSVIPEAWAARERGVIMDVGHGMGSFCFEVCQAAIEQGFKPDTIGSDLHQGSVKSPVYDLPTAISRFLSLGLTLPEVIAAVTSWPAEVLGLSEEVGTLQPGAAGDVAVLDLLEGRFEFRDATDAVLWGEQKLAPLLTVMAGEIVAERGNLV